MIERSIIIFLAGKTGKIYIILGIYGFQLERSAKVKKMNGVVTNSKHLKKWRR